MGRSSRCDNRNEQLTFSDDEIQSRSSHKLERARSSPRDWNLRLDKAQPPAWKLLRVDLEADIPQGIGK